MLLGQGSPHAPPRQPQSCVPSKLNWLHPCSFQLGSLPDTTALAATVVPAARCLCGGVTSKPCGTTACSPAELQGCPRLTCVCSGTHGPLSSGAFSLLGLVIFHTGRLSRTWGRGRLEKLLGQGEGEVAGTGELTAPLLCGKKIKPQAWPQAAGTHLPPSVPTPLGHPGTLSQPQT